MIGGGGVEPGSEYSAASGPPATAGPQADDRLISVHFSPKDLGPSLSLSLSLSLSGQWCDHAGDPIGAANGGRGGMEVVLVKAPLRPRGGCRRERRAERRGNGIAEEGHGRVKDSSTWGFQIHKYSTSSNQLMIANNKGPTNTHLKGQSQEGYTIRYVTYFVSQSKTTLFCKKISDGCHFRCF
ncbi:hypothetical protein B296_00015202 [Ensete ventricosum]|uniref:Uncharacterized protein n=1 Tax=Ensete ventricosum TaxID=4639 RepID=A0A427B6W6_ENSVE|nr:hypothetical protein B296_00015202 [Ensete ventricosum]